MLSHVPSFASLFLEEAFVLFEGSPHRTDVPPPPSPHRPPSLLEIDAVANAANQIIAVDHSHLVTRELGLGINTE